MIRTINEIYLEFSWVFTSCHVILVNQSNGKIWLGCMKNWASDIYKSLSKTCKKCHNAKSDTGKSLKLQYFVVLKIFCNRLQL